jgi:hypothetical protein
LNIDPAALPADVDQLHEIVRTMAARMAEDHRQISDAKPEVEKLRQIVDKLQRDHFGRKSERPDADVARVEVRLPAAESDTLAEEPSPRLPNHLPPEEVTVDVEGHACSHCSGCAQDCAKESIRSLDALAR